jgi:peptide/nickel transport system substrate-binding protein
VELAADVEPLVAGVAAAVPPRSFFGEGDQFDPCAYLLDGLRFPLERLWSATSNTGVDAIAAAYPFLFLERPPIGTGPYRLENITATEAHLRAYDAHHHGRPATSEVTVRVFEDPEEAARSMARGEGTIMLDPAVRAVDAEPGVTVADPHSFVYFALMYNLRPGSLFAELELRRALAMCIDKPSIVDAATGGTGVPFDSPVPPSSWAYQPSIRPVVRDVGAAKALIESAGWVMSEDGIYSKGAERLATVVPVRADQDERVHFVELLALQATDCGMELQPLPVPAEDYFTMFDNFPHLVSETDEPFDIVFGGWVVGPDPDTDQWDSAAITSEQNPRDFNVVGLSDPRVDELLAQGRSTYDQVSRARVYRELQVRINELQPYLSAWAPRLFSGMSSGLRSTAGPLNLDSMYWWWQLETLTLEPAP